MAERARLLLRGHGGRASTTELLAGLFGASGGAPRWERLVETVLDPLPDVRRSPDGAWELVATPRGADSALDAGTFVALATAATGADPWRARLIAIAAVRVEAGTQMARFEAVVNPRCRVPRYVIGATGITQADAEEAPAFAELVDELLDFLGDAPLVGLEIACQIEMLGHELARLDRPGLRNPTLDLADLAARAGLPGKPSLPALAAAAGLTHPRPYHPTVDARVAARVTTRLLERIRTGEAGPPTVEHLSERAAIQSGPLRRSAPPEAPPGPGVYLLEAADGRVLYVGKARDLRTRVLAYHRRPRGLLRRLEGLAEAVANVSVVSARSELEALVLEARLLRHHQPPFNVQRGRRRPALFLRATLTDDQAALGACQEPTSDGRCLGPFRTAGAAAAALRLVRELFPGLRGRSRAGAAARRPLVEAALRFLGGEKDEVIDRLRAEQRSLAAAGDRVGLARSRTLLLRAIEFSPDLAAGWTGPLPDRFLVLSPGTMKPFVVHVIAAGRLLDCFEAGSVASARRRARRLAEPDPTPADDPPLEVLDERSIVLRWLVGLGPEHRIVGAGGKGQASGAEGRTSAVLDL